MTTATSVEHRKRTRALEAWAAILRNEYGLLPRFIHTDKDLAEIGASRQVWPEAKHQLCWWHQREAIRRRLKGNLPTSPYNPQRANCEHAFINTEFKPIGRTDPNDIEGGVPGEICEQGGNANITALASDDPNLIKIRIPISHFARSDQTVPTLGAGGACDQRNLSGIPVSPAINASSSTLTCGSHNSFGIGAFSATEVGESMGTPTFASRCPDSSGAFAHSVNATKLTIRIPAPSTIHHPGPVAENEPDTDEETTNERRTFCPVEHRDAVVGMMERHFCAHPLIPGYSAPTPEHIKTWAVKQAYDFCIQRDLPNLWAYLWVNWYRRGRWELWARSSNPNEIPRLKTTMMVEAQ